MVLRINFEPSAECVSEHQGEIGPEEFEGNDEVCGGYIGQLKTLNQGGIVWAHGVRTLIRGAVGAWLLTRLTAQITVTRVVRGWHFVESYAAVWIQLHDVIGYEMTPVDRGKAYHQDVDTYAY